MLFNSIDFLIFFIVVTTFFFSLPHVYRWILLLVASCFFYMFFKPEYILILGFTIVVDYIAGIKIEGAEKKSTKRQYLILSLIANIGVLAVFKYYNFINDNITGLCQLFGYTNQIPYLKILLPIGLSFHTFQAMSYTIEVYRGNQKAERHFGIYSLYVMYYPQLVAGPIERPQNILHQLKEHHKFSYDRFLSGLTLIGWGLFKKVVVADRLSIITDSMYAGTYGFNTVWSLIGTLFFSFQIYCDFSGYSDIATGCARIMGVHLMTNFNYPYFAKSVSEFWKRWHISLSTWFRDYLYIPLGGNRVPLPRQAFNMFMVFMISGIWHGAGWTFVIWGFLHGVAVTFELITKNPRKTFFANWPAWLHNGLSVFGVFIFVQFVWIFFRAESFQKAYSVIKGFFNYTSFSAQYEQLTAALKYSLLVGFFVLVNFILFEIFMRKERIKQLFEDKPYLRMIFYGYLFLLFIFFGSFKNAQSFIYFQF